MVTKPPTRHKSPLWRGQIGPRMTPGGKANPYPLSPLWRKHPQVYFTRRFPLLPHLGTALKGIVGQRPIEGSLAGPVGRQ